MKPLNLILTVVLWAAVIGMAFWLYKIIEEPVTFAKNLEIRSKDTQHRLMDIKVAQDYYKRSKNTYASNFDDLINTIENEELTIIKTNGDPDDTTVVVTYDTLRVPIIDEIISKKKFKGTSDVKQLRYVPHTENVEFALAMDTIKVQRVKLPVFEAKATKQQYLSGLQEARIKNPAIQDLSIGSLVSASGKGSWE